VGEVGRYLYAVTRGVDANALAGTTGLGGEPVTTVEQDGLVAVIGSVDLDEYGEAGLREHLEDLTWLERVARIHDDVVRAVAERGPTAPLRLATICLDDEAVRARLREWHDPLGAALDRVEGRAEWSVKAYSSAAEVQDDSVPSTAAPSGGAGAAYLQRKRSQATRRREAEELAMSAARALHDSLIGLSVASRLLAAQDPGLTHHAGVMRLNAAYLVPDEEADAFVAEAQRQAATHSELDVEINGPWPAYSFATLEQP
jgi:hypothetical protein